MDLQDSAVLLLCAAGMHIVRNAKNKERNKQRKKRQHWVNDWLKRRSSDGCCVKLLMELRAENPLLYSNFLRMNDKDFDCLVSGSFKYFQNVHLCSTFYSYLLSVGVVSVESGLSIDNQKNNKNA